MTKYLISFPSEAMDLSDEELAAAGVDSRAVIEEAKAAGVYVFGGGINEIVDPVLVTADGEVSDDIYAGSKLNGGFTVPAEWLRASWRARPWRRCDRRGR